MIGKFLWGAAWRTAAVGALLALPFWYFNRAPAWDGDEVIARGDTAIVGKPGLIVVALMQPERFETKFYDNFIDKLFTQVIPWPINVLAGADKGIVLIDPTQPYRTQRFEPAQLADLWGKTTDSDGVSWMEKYRRGAVRWEPPSTNVPHDPGVFLYPERKAGERFAAAKTAIKVRYLYYNRLPGGILPHYQQTRAMAEGAIAEARRRHPALVAGELADAFDPAQKEAAVFRALDAGADTLILASAQPIYSSFEELDGSFVGIYKIVEKWRQRNGMKPIKLVIPPYMASQAAFDALTVDHLAEVTPAATGPGQTAMAIMSVHGLPPAQVKSDSWTQRVAEVEARLAPQLAAVLRAKGYTNAVVKTGSEGFADPLEDPKNEIVSVRELWAEARAKGHRVAVAVPIDFLAENTDNLFAHAAIMFDGFPGYTTYQGPPATVDWQRPYVRRWDFGQTAVIYGGSPGGATVPRQSQALADAISVVLR